MFAKIKKGTNLNFYSYVRNRNRDIYSYRIFSKFHPTSIEAANAAFSSLKCFPDCFSLSSLPGLLNIETNSDPTDYYHPTFIRRLSVMFEKIFSDLCETRLKTTSFRHILLHMLFIKKITFLWKFVFFFKILSYSDEVFYVNFIAIKPLHL